MTKKVNNLEIVSYRITIIHFLITLMTTKLIKGKDNSSYSLLLLHPTGLQGFSDHSSRTEATKYSAVNVTPISLPVHAHTHIHTRTHTRCWTATVNWLDSPPSRPFLLVSWAYTESLYPLVLLAATWEK